MRGDVRHLPARRSLAVLDLVALAGDRAHGRGARYALDGRVTITADGGGAVSAIVVGGQTYLVEVGFQLGELVHRCSCPVGIDGSFCKHLVAVVLAATGGAEAVVAGWSVEAASVVDAVEDLLAAGRAADVIGFCEDAVSRLETDADAIHDEGALAALVERLGDLHLRACAAARLDPVVLARRLFTRAVDDGLGAFGRVETRYAAVLGPRGLAELERLARPS